MPRRKSINRLSGLSRDDLIEVIKMYKYEKRHPKSNRSRRRPLSRKSKRSYRRSRAGSKRRSKAGSKRKSRKSRRSKAGSKRRSKRSRSKRKSKRKSHRRHSVRRLSSPGCSRQYTRKYVIRKSPSYPANKCPGQGRIGNDGNIWVSKPDYRGIHRWTRSGRSVLNNRLF